VNAPGNSKIRRFGDLQINMQTGELLRNGRRVNIPDQPFQILALLLECPGELISREELSRSLWRAGTFVDFDDGLNAAVKRLRQALGDSADNPKFIETIPKRGYRFICPVEPVAGGVPSTTGSEVSREVTTSMPSPADEYGLQVSHRQPGRYTGLQSRYFSGWRGKATLAALAGAVAIAVALFLWSQPKLGQPDSILLTDFVNPTGDSAFDETLKRAVAIDLEQSPYLNVFPPEEVRKTLKLMGKSTDVPINAALGREICQRNGVKAFVVGSIAGLGTRYVVSLEAFDAQSGRLLGQKQEEAANKESVLKALGRASRELRKSLGESLATIHQFGKPLEEATTSSLDALKVFTLGEIELSRREELSSLPFYKRAVELDPNFALAYARLGSAYQNMGEAELAREYMEKAFSLRDRTSERESLYIAAHYYAASGMIDKSIEAYELYKQVYPRDFVPYNNLSIKYLGLARNDEAIKNALGAIALNPQDTNAYVVAATAYIAKNQLRDGREILTRAFERKLDSWVFHDTLARIATIEGDRAAVERENALTQMSPEGKLTLLTREAGEMASRGQFSNARVLYNSAAKTAEQLELKDSAAESLVDKALMEAELGHRSQAEKSVSEALSLTNGLGVRVGAATVLAVAGNAGKALRLINEVAQRAPADTLLQSVFVPQVKAIVELRAKNPHRSLELLASSSPYELLDPMGRYDSANSLLLLTRGEAYLQTHHGEEAEQQFQQILSLRKAYNDDCIYPLALVDLARTYAELGDVRRARKMLEQFLDLWREADQDNWLLEKARREYAELGGTG
jgi:eukaryotic-like serine/threonine-protein kinase